MADAVDSLRPGFNLEATFKGHISNVRLVSLNPVTRRFFTCDDKCLKTWSCKEGNVIIHHSTSFPGYQSTFITAMSVASDMNLLFAACLDGNLRIYNERLNLKSAMPWANGTVRDVIYNKARKEVITAGSCGVRVWDCDLDHEAYKNAKDLNPFDIPRTKDGHVVPWCFGLYQHARNRLNLSIPSATTMAGTPSKESVWCDKIHLHERSQLLFAIFEGSIFGYEMDKGTIVLRFQDLHVSPITTMAYLPNHEILVTSSVDSGGTVWRIAGGKPHRYKEIGSSHITIHHLAADDEETSLLAATGDGVVTLWAVETLLAVYKMKLPQLAVKPTFVPSTPSTPPRFFLHFDSDVKVFSIQNLYHGWMECNSEPRSLKQLSYGLILASYGDSSIRILDSASTASDKAAITTVPQLSTSSLLTAACSLSSGRLFTLLSNGSIHVWDLHLRGPPTFAEAWTHLDREQCTCMEFLDGEAASDELTRAWGMFSAPHHQSGSKGTRDHLILGTKAGDVIVVSVHRKGLMMFRFPAYKYQAVEHLSLDYEQDVLITTSKNTIKVWSMVTGEVKCKYTVEASSDVSRAELLEGRALFGTASGSLVLLDLKTGRTVSSTSSDHQALVTGIGASVHLQHFVTCSSDRCVKILDRDKNFKRSIYLAQHINCCSFLNDAGDLLIGLGHRLVVVKAALYEFASPRDDDEDASHMWVRKESIYHGLKGTGTRSKALSRADHSLYRKALSSADLPSYIKNMKADVIRHVAEEGNAAWRQEQSLLAGREPIQRSITLALAVEQRHAHKLSPPLNEGEAKQPTPTPASPMPAIPAPSARTPAPAADAVGVTSSPQKLPPITQSQSLRERDSDHQPPSLQLQQEIKQSMPSARIDSAVKWSTVLEKGALQKLRDDKAKASTEHDEDSHMDEEDESESGSEEEEEEEEEDEEGERDDDEGEEESPEATKRMMEEVARASKIKAALEAYYEASAALAQRRREHRQFLKGGQDSTELRGMVETRFLLNLAKEAQKRDRKMFGGGALEAEPEHHVRKLGGKWEGATNVTIGSDGKAMMKVGDLLVEVTEESEPQSSTLDPHPQGESVGEDMLHSIRMAAEAGHGLSAAFKKVLPVISSSSAFLEVDGVGGELKVKRTKLKRGLKKKKVKSNPKSDQANGELGKKKKKKKKKKKRQTRKAILESIDPARALALGQKDHGILEELKQMELHRMMTKQVAPGRSNSLKIKPPPRSTQPPSNKAKDAIVDGRAAPNEPPDPTVLLEALRGGWRASLSFPASAPSKNLRPQNQEVGSTQALTRGPSIILGTDELNAVLTSMHLKPHIHQGKDHPTIPGLKYNPRHQEDDAQSHKTAKESKSRGHLVHVPSLLIKEGLTINNSRAMTPDDELLEAGMMESKASARSLLLNNAETKSKVMQEKKKAHINFANHAVGKADEPSGFDREQSSTSLAAIIGRQRQRGHEHGDHQGLEAARKMQPLMMRSVMGRLSSGGIGSSPRKHFASADKS